MGIVFAHGLSAISTGIKALFLVAVVSAPLIAAGVVHAQSDSIIEGSSRAPTGAGFVLMVSLQRAR